jgi:hypothetical protein
VQVLLDLLLLAALDDLRAAIPGIALLAQRAGARRAPVGFVSDIDGSLLNTILACSLQSGHGVREK